MVGDTTSLNTTQLYSLEYISVDLQNKAKDKNWW